MKYFVFSYIRTIGNYTYAGNGIFTGKSLTGLFVCVANKKTEEAGSAITSFHEITAEEFEELVKNNNFSYFS